MRRHGWSSSEERCVTACVALSHFVSIGIFGMLPRITCDTIAAFVSGSQAKKHSETLEHEVNMLSTYMYTLGR